MAAAREANTAPDTTQKDTNASSLSKPEQLQCEPVDVDSEEELERLACEELLKKAKQDKLRAERVGVCGWHQTRPKTNKRFANNLLTSTVLSNKRLKSDNSSGRTEKNKKDGK